MSVSVNIQPEYVADWLNRNARNFVPSIGYEFGVLAVTVVQTCSLLYRRFLTCQMSPASNVLPITNRRYGRLKICATVNRYSIAWRIGPGENPPNSVRALRP